MLIIIIITRHHDLPVRASIWAAWAGELRMVSRCVIHKVLIDIVGGRKCVCVAVCEGGCALLYV